MPAIAQHPNLFQGPLPPGTGQPPNGISQNPSVQKFYANPADYSSAGNGPLAHWLASTELCAPGLPEPTDTEVCALVKDKWGNDLLCMFSTRYDWEVDPRSQHEKGALPNFVLANPVAMFDIYGKFCNADMAVEGLDVRLLVPQSNSLELGPSDRSDQLQLDSYNYFGDPSAIVDGYGRPMNPADSYDNPWIDGVPMKIPVAKDDQAVFGGWVTLRVNRFTRIAVITGLYYQGWGDRQTAKIHLGQNIDDVWTIVAKTLLSWVKLIAQAILSIVGVSISLGGTTASGTESFPKFSEEQKAAFEKAMRDALTHSSAGPLSKDLADEWKKNQTSPAGPNNWAKWLLPAAAVGLPIAAKYAALI